MVATWLLVIAHFLSQAFRKSGEARGKKGREKIKTVSPRCSLTFLTSRRSQLSERLLNTLYEHYLDRPSPGFCKQQRRSIPIINQYQYHISSCPHLLAIIHKLSIKKVLHQRSLTEQFNVIVRATINRAACDSLGTNVGMPIKGKLDFLSLVWMQRAVQR